MTALPLSTRIHVSGQKTVKHRTRIAQFGDGYSQRVPDGINSRVESWSVSWPGLNETDYQTVISTLDAAGAATALTWTPPGDSTVKKYVLTPDGYSVMHHGRGLYSISATLQQVFEP